MDTVVWRNHTGAIVDVDCPRCKMKVRLERPQRFGLCVGSSDIIGIHRGKFLAVETKVKGRKATEEQTRFIELVKRMGGIAGVATSADLAEALLEEHDAQADTELAALCDKAWSLTP